MGSCECCWKDNRHISGYRRRYRDCAASWTPCESWFDFRTSQDTYLFKKESSPAEGLTMPPPQQMPRTFIPEDGDDGEWSWSLSPYSADVKNVRSYILPYMPLGLYRDELPSLLHFPEQKVYSHRIGQIPNRTPYNSRPDIVPKTSVIRPDILSQALPLPSSAVRPAKDDMWSLVMLWTFPSTFLLVKTLANPNSFRCNVTQICGLTFGTRRYTEEFPAKHTHTHTNIRGHDRERSSFSWQIAVTSVLGHLQKICWV